MFGKGTVIFKLISTIKGSKMFSIDDNVVDH